MSDNNRTSEQVLEDLERRLSQYDTPENRAFMQTEVHAAIYSLGAHCRGMVMAERLFRDYPPEQFKALVRLSFSEARERLFYMTGIDLLDTGENGDG